MKKIILFTAVLVVVTSANTKAAGASGTVFGTMSTARSLGLGEGAFGFGVGIADRTSVLASFSYGLSDYTDGRIKLGLADDSDVNTTLSFGMDFKYQLLDAGMGLKDPLDLALGGFLEYVDFDLPRVIQIGAQVLGSYPFALRNETTLTPYGRFNIRWEKSTIQTSEKVKDGDGFKIITKEKTESELRFGLNAGVCWDVSKDLGLYGEFQIDGNDGLFFGLSYRVL